MKNKQILALMLAGMLAVSPLAVSAEEALTDDTAVEAVAEEVVEPAVEETQPEETVSEAAAEETTEVTVDTTTTTTEAAETPAAEVTPEVTEAPSNLIASETDLITAINSAADNTETALVLTGDFTISQTITVPAGKVITLSADKAVTITRVDGYTGDMFAVGGTLQIQKTLEYANPITVDAYGNGTTGSILKIYTNGIARIDDTVTLKNNDTTANGGAVNNEGGSLYMDGGTIMDNTAPEGAAVYTSGTVFLTGNLTVSGNTRKDSEDEENNIALIESGVIVADQMLSNTTPISVYRVGGTEGETVLADQSTAGAAAAAVANGQIVYAEEGFVISEAGTLTAETQEEEVPEVTPVLTKADDGTAGIVWAEDGSSFTFTVVSDTNGEIYWGFGETGNDEAVPEFDLTAPQGTVTANEVFTITVSRDEIPTDTAQTLYVLIKSENNILSAKKSIPVEIPEVAEDGTAEEVGENPTDTDTDTSDTDTTDTDTTDTDGTDTTDTEDTDPEPERFDVTVTTTGGSYTYDGKAHGATVTVSGLPDGYTYEASSSATATHVSESPVTATYDTDTLVIKNESGEDVTEYADITKKDGTIIIKPATVSISTESATKTYDGDALTANGSISGIVSGETYSFTVNGTQTEVGSSDNSYIMIWASTDNKYTARESDYTVEATIGLLTVNKDTSVVTRDPIVRDVSDSVVTGLDEPVLLKPNVAHSFSVKGAGTTGANVIPPVGVVDGQTVYVDGDTRWTPANKWQQVGSNGSLGKMVTNSSSIKSETGISTEKTLTIRIYLKKEVYSKSDDEAVGEWIETDEEGYITKTFTTQAYSDDEDSTSTTEEDTTVSDGTATTNDGTTSTTGSSSANNAKTADTNPIGTLSMMAMLSLLAGGYVIVRKRKKEEI